ncbi:uracil-DNA glycosylase family protein [Aquimarina sp. 2201CG14-23]|uniref:uracil-DNA glycosylase family protein n=1 Tax=Aquimarina mycalae TaxID=3040073 RepID=UPI002477D89A|nr:uracil-DNA glycosylase family protein [Aquimarina sp. 2201CG14-23]MDH7447921.1 uracil-DNA glycosylase family protein [Aquimarina sp. 2201CG14-23]
MDKLLAEISRCTVCSDFLELGPRPIVSGSIQSKVIIIGQAPGSIVHKTGIPWDDKSGENLRRWLGVNETTFYDPDKIGLVPMGFCYPGKGKSGDLPPRKECAPLWHEQLLQKMEGVKLTILVGKYAQDYYLRDMTKRTLTETVKNFETYLPNYFVLPHPSPRNNIWQAKNEWFGKEVLPKLKETILELKL